MPNRKDNQEQANPPREHGKGRGFAGMNPEQQREIASEGGRAAHASGHAHEFTSEEARAAGRKGGEARSRSSSRLSSGTDSDLQSSRPIPADKPSDVESSDPRRGGRGS